MQTFIPCRVHQQLVENKQGWIICMEKPPDASTTTLSTRAYFGEIAPDTEPETYSLVCEPYPRMRAVSQDASRIPGCEPYPRIRAVSQDASRHQYFSLFFPSTIIQNR
ncbi:hypothetical protein LINGRAHAP2_LOCUS25338, partial [Linum grandiflorum]